MVGARYAKGRQKFASEGTKTALHPVPDDSAANLLRHGKADPPGGVAIRSVANEKDESGHRLPAPLVRREEVGAPRDDRDRACFPSRVQALRLLRPRARRARRMLRPPTVAMRARKPCRRLRTRLLG
jgi:hypothetical protein